MRHTKPGVPLSGIILNGHAASTKVSETFDPSVFERWDAFVEECNHAVCKVNEGQHAPYLSSPNENVGVSLEYLVKGS